MNISTFSRYGLRALVRMSIMLQENGGNPVSLKHVAEHENISLKYLENIFSVLRKNQIVLAKRGKFGGYALSDNPENISIHAVLEALEGNVSLINCLVNQEECLNDPACCTIRPLWSNINHMVITKLKETTLADLVKGAYAI